MNFPAHFAQLRIAASTIVLHRDHAGHVSRRYMLNRKGRRQLAAAYATAARAERKSVALALALVAMSALSWRWLQKLASDLAMAFFIEAIATRMLMAPEPRYFWATLLESTGDAAKAALGPTLPNA